LPHRLQLVHPRADSGEALLDLLAAALPARRLGVHTYRMPAPSSFATMDARLRTLLPEVRHAFRAWLARAHAGPTPQPPRIQEAHPAGIRAMHAAGFPAVHWPARGRRVNDGRSGPAGR
jgi:hypothetical protein